MSTDPKLAAVASAAGAFQQALNDYGKSLSIAIDLTDATSLADDEPRIVFNVSVTRTNVEVIFG
ncbi:MAG TPA: hypothetical protein VIK69_09165 [Methylophilaceae bacterium]